MVIQERPLTRSLSIPVPCILSPFIEVGDRIQALTLGYIEGVTDRWLVVRDVHPASPLPLLVSTDGASRYRVPLHQVIAHQKMQHISSVPASSLPDSIARLRILLPQLLVAGASDRAIELWLGKLRQVKRIARDQEEERRYGALGSASES